MEFGIIVEANLQSGKDMLSFQQRYNDVLEEAVLADRMGFHAFGASEQHFYSPTCVISSPETLLSAVAVLTKNIKIRTATILLPFQHPVHVAENLATIDILSQGRLEFGSGKGNSWHTIEGFGLHPDELEDRWRESLDVVVKALRNEKFSHQGKYWNVPERALSPMPVQDDIMMWYASISPKSHEITGKLGMGLMTLSVGVSLEKLAERIQIYRNGIKEAKPIGKRVTNKVSCFTQLLCADTSKEAEDAAKGPFIDYLESVVDLYEQKLKASGTKVDFTQTRKMIDWDYVNDTNQVVVGDPDQIIRKLEAYEKAGVDEILIRSEGVEHDKVMRSIELIGKHVIPYFENKKNINISVKG